MTQPNDHSEGNNGREIDELMRIPHRVLPPTYTSQFRAMLEQEVHDEEDSLPPRLIEDAERAMTTKIAQERQAIAEKEAQLAKKEAQCRYCKFYQRNRYITCAVNPLFMQGEEVFCRDYEEEEDEDEIIIDENDESDEVPVVPPDAPDLNSFSNVGVSFSTAAEALIRIWTAGRFS